MMLPHLVVLLACFDNAAPGPPRAAPPPLALAALGLLTALPLLFVFANFAKNQVLDRLAAREEASDEHLHVPQLASHGLAGVREAIAAAVRSERDAVLVCAPDGSGSSFVAWLAVARRSLPVGHYHGPLVNATGDATAFDSDRPFRASRPTRVIVVIAKSFRQRGETERFLSRFPQARSWARFETPESAAVEVLASDL
jgi:hypothetical protein